MLAPVKLRPGAPDDGAACGRIAYEAFGSISSGHNFPNDFPSIEIAIRELTSLLNNPGFYSVVAEIDGQVVGSNFLDERSPIAGLGPITVDPKLQNRRVGRLLMLDTLNRAEAQRHPGVRLVQAAYHNRSLSLYAKLGFQVREPLACLQGSQIGEAIPNHTVRPAVEADLEACNRLCVRVHGHDRAGELREAIAAGTAVVVDYTGGMSGYATAVGFDGHAVGETNEDLKAMLAAARVFAGPGILVPTRNSALFRWCLDNGLRVVQVMTLMSRGLYNEPAGAYLPSILY
ncbi:MAG TPA: GNAT family N-acetyltransferase [Candidatus Dormibacteraeota bacterium]|nr:GNAT family N-acetyltransferase [Candidatus Dormibacteraeota bacterium]